jgi:hypothetical protein
MERNRSVSASLPSIAFDVISTVPPSTRIPKNGDLVVQYFAGVAVVVDHVRTFVPPWKS